MKKFRTLAGMAVFALGVLATSSCSKDEFFGLEDSQFIDASTKTEIAMSQEYVDFVLACSEMADYMSQPMDTTTAEVKIGPDGKRILYKEGPQLSAMALFEVLKEKYPELEKADKMDLDEILKIALSKNTVLKGEASKATPKTKAVATCMSWYWAQTLGKTPTGFNAEYWSFKCFPYMDVSSIQGLLLIASGNDEAYLGGLIFSDLSIATMSSGPESWPSIVNDGYPRAGSDFVIYYSSQSLGYNPSKLARQLGPEYYEGSKTHYVFMYEGYGEEGRKYMENYISSSFIYQ